MKSGLRCQALKLSSREVVEKPGMQKLLCTYSSVECYGATDHMNSLCSFSILRFHGTVPTQEQHERVLVGKSEIYRIC